MPALEAIVESQLTSLDDTDALATAWAQALEAAASSNKLVWGGRGKGGRGLARRTYQRYDVVVEQVRLEYINQANLHCKVLLEGTTLKLLSPRVYVLVGINGVGKSTLLRRIEAGKIPGFPPHISSMYIPQEVLRQPDKTPMDIVLSHHDAHLRRSTAAHQSRIEQLEALMEDLDLTTEEGERQMQASCEQIAALEEQAQGRDVQLVRQHAEEALRFFGFDRDAWDVPSAELSGGHLKKVVLACALFCHNDLLLLDEPTNFLDVGGLLQLRRLISICTERNTTILMVSHDVDLVNEVATDIIHMFGNQLNYYPGNYRDFVGYRAQQDLHSLRQNAALAKKREAIMTSIDNLKKAPIPKRGGGKKKGKQIEARKKKLEKVGLEKNELGHRWTAQKAGTGIREGSINSVDATTRKNMTYAQLLKQPETNVANAPDKAVQFV
jgi:ATP-binding cassette, subfamily F, member 3